MNQSDGAGLAGASPAGGGGGASLAGGTAPPIGARGPKPTSAAVACRATRVSAAVPAISDQIQQHPDRIFLVFSVVVRANADRPEAEPPVEARRRRVRTPHLERDEATATRAAFVDDVGEKPGRVTSPARLGGG